MVREAARAQGAEIEWLQTNHEGAMVDAVQGLRGRVDGALINAAALTHSSLALRDALLGGPHSIRRAAPLEHLRARARAPALDASRISPSGVVTGFGAQSYLLALQALVGRLRGG